MNQLKATLRPTTPVWPANLLRFIYILIGCSPWLWLIVFGLFVGVVTVQFGHLPLYGQPDPKEAGPISILYFPTILLLVWGVGVTPIGLALAGLSLWKGIPKSVRLPELALYAGGLILFWFIALNDVAGLMTWLAD